MHATDRTRQTTTTACPVCGKSFQQRLDGRPKTCGRSCARKLEWTKRTSAHRYVNNQGYVLVAAPEDYEGKTYKLAGASRTPMMLEHRKVMSDHVGRALLSTETVHHKDGDRANNNIDNLELHVGRHAKGATHAHCASCTCFDEKEV